MRKGRRAAASNGLGNVSGNGLSNQPKQSAANCQAPLASLVKSP